MSDPQHGDEINDEPSLLIMILVAVEEPEKERSLLVSILYIILQIYGAALLGITIATVVILPALLFFDHIILPWFGLR